MKYDIWREDIPGLFRREGSVNANDLDSSQKLILERKVEVSVREKDIFLITPVSSTGGDRQGLRFRIGKTKPKLIAEVVN